MRGCRPREVPGLPAQPRETTRVKTLANELENEVAKDPLGASPWEDGLPMPRTQHHYMGREATVIVWTLLGQ